MSDDSARSYGASAPTSLSLIHRIRANDSQAWSHLRKIYLPLIYLWCRGAAPPDAAADIGQEVLLAVSLGIEDFERSPERVGSFRAWLRSITQNKICDYFRKNHPELAATGGNDALQQLSEQPDYEYFPEEEESGVLYAQALEIISCEFPDWYKTAFLRAVIENHHMADIAADLGRKVSAVYVAKSRVLQRLREEFKDLID